MFVASFSQADAKQKFGIALAMLIRMQITEIPDRKNCVKCNRGPKPLPLTSFRGCNPVKLAFYLPFISAFVVAPLVAVSQEDHSYLPSRSSSQ